MRTLGGRSQKPELCTRILSCLEEIRWTHNRPFPSSPESVYHNEVKCSAFDIEMIFHSQTNITHFHRKGCALGLILKVGGFGTRKWPIGLISLCRNKGLFDSEEVSGCFRRYQNTVYVTTLKIILFQCIISQNYFQMQKLKQSTKRKK